MGGVVELDIDNPLHNFSSVLTYTCIDECYPFGVISNGDLKVNGKLLDIATTVPNYSNTAHGVKWFKLKAGDIVTTSNTQPNLFICAPLS